MANQSNISAGADVMYYDLAPVGSIVMFGGSASDPDGWLICDGRAVSRSTYAGLFGVISTTYGVGDGSTTFNIPDLRGRSPLGTNDAALPNGADGGLTTRNEGDEGGEETHQLTTAELAAHTHPKPAATGFVSGDAVNASNAGAGAGDDLVEAGSIDANTGSTGSDTAHNTMHPFTTVNFLIKT